MKQIEDYPEWVKWFSAMEESEMSSTCIHPAYVEEAILSLLERIDTLTDVINKDWNERGLEVPKDTRMPMTEAHFYKIIDMNGELIDEQKAEIARLKFKNNHLQLKLRSKHNEHNEGK